MEKLSLKKFENKKLTSLTSFVGGDGKTKYTGNQGSSGTDTYKDSDGNGHYNAGDCVTLDDGRTIDC